MFMLFFGGGGTAPVVSVLIIKNVQTITNVQTIKG